MRLLWIRRRRAARRRGREIEASEFLDSLRWLRSPLFGEKKDANPCLRFSASFFLARRGLGIRCEKDWRDGIALCGFAANHFDDVGMRVAEAVDGDAAEKIEIFFLPV